MKIRKRDGTMGEVADDYILRDGEAMRGRTAVHGSRSAAMIHDGSGHPAGQRPGFLFNDDERAEQARRRCLSRNTTQRLANAGVRDRASGQARRVIRTAGRSTARKLRALPPMRIYDEAIQRALAQQ